MPKGKIIDIVVLDNAIVIWLFKIFQFAIGIEDEGYGKYLFLRLGIGKLEYHGTLRWRNKIFIDSNPGIS